jgi:hypothetical protein
MAFVLTECEERALMARVRVLLRRLADVWDPSEGGEEKPLQTVAKKDLKEASDLSDELERFV